MRKPALEKLKRQREALSREIEVLQKKPACYSLEMERYRSARQSIERQIVTLERGQASGLTVLSISPLDQAKS
jgi:cell division protein FtsB